MEDIETFNPQTKAARHEKEISLRTVGKQKHKTRSRKRKAKKINIEPPEHGWNESKEVT